VIALGSRRHWRRPAAGRCGCSRDGSAYLNRLHHARGGLEAVGFKLMYGHPEVHAGVLLYLAAWRAWAIHLVRENLLDQVVTTAESAGRRITLFAFQ
jgi:hypothetical protein